MNKIDYFLFHIDNLYYIMDSSLNKNDSSNSVINTDNNETNDVTSNRSTELLEPNIEPPMERDEKQILEQLEQDGYDKVRNIGKTLPKNATNKDLGDALLNIIKSGASDFEKKTGRPMSYLEMRYAYG